MCRESLYHHETEEEAKDSEEEEEEEGPLSITAATRRKTAEAGDAGTISLDVTRKEKTGYTDGARDITVLTTEHTRMQRLLRCPQPRMRPGASPTSSSAIQSYGKNPGSCRRKPGSRRMSPLPQCKYVFLFPDFPTKSLAKFILKTFYFYCAESLFTITRPRRRQRTRRRRRRKRARSASPLQLGARPRKQVMRAPFH